MKIEMDSETGFTLRIIALCAMFSMFMIAGAIAIASR